MRVIQPSLGAGYNRGCNSNERVREHFSERCGLSPVLEHCRLLTRCIGFLLLL